MAKRDPTKGATAGLYYHSKQRAKERYDLDLTPTLYMWFVRQIQTNKAEVIYQLSLSAVEFWVWRRDHPDVRYRVLWNPREQTIASFLPARPRLIDRIKNPPAE